MTKHDRIVLERDWAWAAGLFEGEGCVINRRRKPPQEKYWKRGLSVQMGDGDVVQRFAAVVGAGSVRHQTNDIPSRPDHWTTMWCWSCTNWPDIERILNELLPYLGMRRREAALALLANPADEAFGGEAGRMKGREIVNA